MAGLHILLARVPLISATHRGPVVNLVAWITVTTMCLAVITVLISKLVVLRRLAWNDSILIAAMVFSIGFTIAINQQVSGGLGSEISTLTADQYEKFQKAGYAWNILYITSLSFGKVSTLSLLLALSPNKSYRIPMLATGGLTAVWAIASIIASAFQCSLPHPYLITTSKCFSQEGFWDAVGVIDILTDVALMAIPIWLVHNLQLPVKKKIAVCFAFSFRTLAIACTIWRISEMHHFFDRSADVTFESWLPTIATLLEVFFSVFSACVPHLRPFMESIQAGYLSGVIQEGDGRFGYGNDSYLMGKMAQSKTGSAIRSQALKSELRGESLDLPRQGATIGHMNDSAGHGIGQALTSSNRIVVNKVSAGRPEKEFSSERHRSESITSEGGRSHGSDGSKAMIIKTTKEWSVSYQDA
ncbi:uncharacterized protein PV07_10038 [Cladophialophora immunda]|uniref:Rhodopsin domain-containing protein n=1 Tax=Cladophialophora immunda TaxID=569365 RepID=A0A0D1Z9F5_9EURO|nr:uncharacterized protein PV07_10038 [Cladophialophora immunda]KIW24311.1 hypothetical protein PV07_10038 [Cladophialophora immunda]OQU97859.1 hypothetical protein CLAIMM_03737 isoform 2 [Cladophialophora immunda]